MALLWIGPNKSILEVVVLQENTAVVYTVVVHTVVATFMQVSFGRGPGSTLENCCHSARGADLQKNAGRSLLWDKTWSKGLAG